MIDEKAIQGPLVGFSVDGRRRGGVTEALEATLLNGPLGIIIAYDEEPIITVMPESIVEALNRLKILSIAGDINLPAEGLGEADFAEGLRGIVQAAVAARNEMRLIPTSSALLARRIFTVLLAIFGFSVYIYQCEAHDKSAWIAPTVGSSFGLALLISVYNIFCFNPRFSVAGVWNSLTLSICVNPNDPASHVGDRRDVITLHVADIVRTLDALEAAIRAHFPRLVNVIYPLQTDSTVVEVVEEEKTEQPVPLEIKDDDLSTPLRRGAW